MIDEDEVEAVAHAEANELRSLLPIGGLWRVREAATHDEFLAEAHAASLFDGTIRAVGPTIGEALRALAEAIKTRAL